jgi:hypothetical protein
MANTFVTGRYYKNERRDIVILVTSRTKCFINYKEFWISDFQAGKSYQDGKVKVRLNENNDEFVLIDGFSKYSSVDEYVKYVKEVNVKEEEVKEEVNVKEYYSAVHRNFLQVGKKFRYVDLKNDVIQNVVFEDSNDHGRVLNFRAINKDGNPIYCHGSLFVVTEHNRDCLKPFRYLTLEDSNLPLHTNAIAKDVKEESNVKEVLEDSNLPLPTNAIAKDVKEESNVKEGEGFKLTDDNKAAIQAIVKLDPVRCNWSNLERTAYSKLEAWVSYPHDSRDIRGVYEGALLVLNTISKEDKARVKELVIEGKTKSLTFKEVREYAQDNGYEIEPLLGMFRLIKNNVIKTFPSLKTLQLFITEEKEEDKARVKELVEKKKITLEDSDLPTNAIALVGKVTEVKILTKMVAVNLAVHHEVKLIHDAIFGWQLMGADSQLLREPLNEGGTQPTLKFKTREGASTFAIKLMAKVKELVEGKTKPFEVIKEGRLLNGEFSNLPLPTKPTDNNAIATVNNLEEEKEEDNMALTKESYEAVKILVKYDFNDKNLTQFEVMALTSLKKYIQNGVEPKLIKTFAEVLIKKLTPEERRELRDKSLTKVIKNKERLDDVLSFLKIGDILKKDENELNSDDKTLIREFLEENKHLDIKSVPRIMGGGAIYRFDLTCHNWHEVLKDKGFVREALYFALKYGVSHKIFNDLAKENLRRHIRGGVLSEEDFLNLCESEGIKKDNAHEISLKWLEFIDSMSVDCESWEESWEEFKKSEAFNSLKATS